MTGLLVRLLGSFEVHVDDEPASGFDSDKVRALLAYLAVESDRPYRRQKLAGLLWPDYPERSARTSLRRALANLRDVIGDRDAEPPYLHITRQSIQFNSESSARSDVGEFSRLASGGLDEIRQAVDLYQGEFLEGFSIADSAAFEEWIVLTRQSLHNQVLRALHRLAGHHASQGEYEQALRCARRAAELEPYDEEALRLLMRTLASAGQRSQALAEYEVFKELLKGELGVEPSEETREMASLIDEGFFEDTPPLIGGLRGYEVRLLLGQGHFGAVYRASQPAVGREVAIKVILPEYANDPGFIRRFEVEAQLVAQLEHPHIVPLYDYWREPDGAYLVMRWLKGGSLEQALQKGPWSGGAAASLVDQVASALSAAHQRGVVHRDVKPANILLDEMGNAYLSDFGIAALLAPADMSLDPGSSPDGDDAGSLGYLSPEAARGESSTPFSDIYSLGVVLYELLTGEHPFPGLEGEALIAAHREQPIPSTVASQPQLPGAVDEVISRATTKEPSERYPDALSLATAFRQALTGEVFEPVFTPDMQVTNPYKGLRAFQEADADSFFGREQLLARLTGRLERSSEDYEEGRFLAVVGPSGSGKSSLVKAGLIPALRRGAVPGSGDWFITEMTPGEHPYEELEAALLRVAVNPPEQLLAQLRGDRRGLLRAVKRCLPANEGTELFLLIDQFEELFTQSDPEERRSFLELLLTSVEASKGRIRLVITLRADFYDKPLQVPGFSELVRESTEVVTPMTVDDLTRAIEEPASRAGVGFEAGLVARIAAEVSQQPGGLPLLQYALTELFERRENGHLTRGAYEAIGGVYGALAGRAEGLYSQLDGEGREAARQVFLRLVTLGEGLEDTRRRVTQAELQALCAETGLDKGNGHFSQEKLDQVIELYGGYRLLTFDRDRETREPTVEVAHEALLREWGRLRAWLDESRADVRTQRVLGNLALEWQQADKDPSFLLRGSRLDQFESWIGETDLVLSALELSYLEASLEGRRERKAEEAAQEAREKALERRSRLFLRGLVVVFALAALVSAGLAFFALDQRQSALDSAANAQNVALVAGSQAALADHDTDTALALAWQAVALNPDSALAQAQLSETAYAPGTARILAGNPDVISRFVISPDDRWLLAGADDGTVILWDIATGELIWQVGSPWAQQADPPWVQDVAFSPDGQVAAATFDDGILFLQAADGELIRRIESPVNRQKIAFDPAGDHFATIGSKEASRLVIWDFASLEPVSEYSRGSEIEDIVYTQDGSAILIASNTGVLTMLDAHTVEVIYEVQEDLGTGAGRLSSISLSPDGTRVAAPFSNAGLLVWDLATGDLLHHFPYQGGLLSLAFHPDGTLLVGGQGILQTDPQTGVVLHANTSQSSAILDLAVTSDGRRAVSSSLDGSVRLWDLWDGQVVRRFAEPNALLFELALSPDARTVLAASTDGTATLWDVGTGEEIWRFVDDQPVMSVAFSPDGRKALVGAGYRIPTKIESGHIILLDVGTGEEIQRFEGQPYAVFDVEFSPDGRLALSAGNGAIVILWDVGTGEEIRRFDDYWVDSMWPDDSYWDAEFSPDGRQIFASHADGRIIAWDLESGEEIQQLDGHDQGGKFILNRDGQKLLSGGADSQVILWDVPAGNILRRFNDHAGGVGHIRFSPDETLLLGGGSDGSSSLWRLETGEVVRRYGSGFVFSPIFTQDGRHAVVGYRDGAVELWRIDSTLDELLSWTRDNRYIPELTCEQRELYRVEPLCEQEP